jgi:hypothetical protein
MVETRGETPRTTDHQIVADNTEPLDAMMEPIETRQFELAEPIGNDTAPSFKSRFQSRPKMHVEAVNQQVTAAKGLSIPDQLIETESDCRIVSAHDRTRADADDRFNANIVTNELPKHADVSGSTQAAPAQHDADVNCFGSVRHSFLGLVTQCDGTACDLNTDT